LHSAHVHVEVSLEPTPVRGLVRGSCILLAAGDLMATVAVGEVELNGAEAVEDFGVFARDRAVLGKDEHAELVILDLVQC